jgi:hypothetical protein
MSKKPNKSSPKVPKDGPKPVKKAFGRAKSNLCLSQRRVQQGKTGLKLVLICTAAFGQGPICLLHGDIHAGIHRNSAA